MGTVLCDCELHLEGRLLLQLSTRITALLYQSVAIHGCRSVQIRVGGPRGDAQVCRRTPRPSLTRQPGPDICAKLVAQLDTSYTDFDTAFKVGAVVLALLPLDQRQPSVHNIRHSLLEAGALRVRPSRAQTSNCYRMCTLYWQCFCLLWRHQLHSNALPSQPALLSFLNVI